MNPNISLPQLPSNLDPALRDYLFAWQKLITNKQLDDYSANVKLQEQTQGIFTNYKNITVKRNTSYPNYQVDIKWDRLWIEGIESTSGDFTIDITKNGLLGLDTGAEANSTWYYAWIIAKADGTVSALLSASATAPTLPAGYIYKRLVSMVRNDSGGNFVDFVQHNERWYYATETIMKQGSAFYNEILNCSQWIPEQVEKAHINLWTTGQNTSIKSYHYTYLYSYVNGAYPIHIKAYSADAPANCWNVVHISSVINVSSRSVRYASIDGANGSQYFLTILTISYFEVTL